MSQGAFEARNLRFTVPAGGGEESIGFRGELWVFFFFPWVFGSKASSFGAQVPNSTLQEGPHINLP